MTYTVDQVVADQQPFVDQHGNTWLTVVFKEHMNEPVKWVVKDPSKITVGMQVDGEIKQQTGKSGKPYARFFRDKPQQGGSKPPRNDDAITASWAVGQASQMLITSNSRNVDADTLAATAQMFVDAHLETLNYIKGKQTPPIAAPVQTPAPAPAPVAHADVAPPDYSDMDNMDLAEIPF